MGAHPNNVHFLYTKAISHFFISETWVKFFEKGNLLREWTDIKYRKGNSMELCAHSPQTTIIQVSIHEFLKSIFVI